MDCFHKCKSKPLGVNSHCKKCREKDYLKYYESNKDVILQRGRDYKPIYRAKYPERVEEQRLRYKQNYPWIKTLHYIRARCNNPNHNNYKKYGAKGIKCLITKEELKVLWFRDKAHKMKKPSIDRLDPEDHYRFNNCQYLEHKENSCKRAYN